MKLGDQAPHCFAIADIAYRNLIVEQIDQSILVSGESGAGKTETAKYLLQHLASLSNQAELCISENPEKPRCFLDAATLQGDSLEQRVLASNPILEAFGNARTVRNPNSSRYGKFIQLYFRSPFTDKAKPPHPPRVIGASISIFLLERSRVVHVAPGEGNYHIFGQLRSAAADARASMAAGPSPTAAAARGAADDGGALRRLLTQLVETEEVRILGEAGAVGGLSVDDLAGFEQTVRAMRGVGMGGGEVALALETAAAVMSLGNVGLAGAETRNAQDVARLDGAAASARALGRAAALLGLAPEALLAGLCRRVVRGGGRDAVTVELTRRQAEDARDALCKAVFERLFAWIVRRVNRTLRAAGAAGGGPDGPEADWTGSRRIGVLDIFGCAA
jgi:myosin-5